MIKPSFFLIFISALFLSAAANAQEGGVYRVASQFGTSTLTGVGTLVSYRHQRYFMISATHVIGGENVQFLSNERRPRWIQLPITRSLHNVDDDISILEIDPNFVKAGGIATGFRAYFEADKDWYVENLPSLKRMKPQFPDFIAHEGGDEAALLANSFEPVFVDVSKAMLLLTPKEFVSEALSPSQLSGHIWISVPRSDSDSELMACDQIRHLFASNEYVFCIRAVEGMSGSPLVQRAALGQPLSVMGVLKQYDVYQVRSYASEISTVMATLRRLIQGETGSIGDMAVILENGSALRVSRRDPGLRELAQGAGYSTGSRGNTGRSGSRADGGRSGSRADGGATAQARPLESLQWQHYLRNGKTVHVIEIVERAKRNTNQSACSDPKSPVKRRFLADLDSRRSSYQLISLLGPNGSFEVCERTTMPDLRQTLIARLQAGQGKFEAFGEITGVNLNSDMQTFTVEAGVPLLPPLATLAVNGTHFTLTLRDSHRQDAQVAQLTFDQQSFQPVMHARLGDRNVSIDLRPVFFDTPDSVYVRMHSHTPVASDYYKIALNRKSEMAFAVGIQNKSTIQHMRVLRVAKP